MIAADVWCLFVEIVECIIIYVIRKVNYLIYILADSNIYLE